MTDIICIMFIGVVVFSCLFGFISPLVSKYYVNNSIEKRYKCKLNLENDKALRIFLYHYFKLSYPSSAIGGAYLWNKNKYIERIPGLKSIHYDFKTAPKQEIVISCLNYIMTYLILIGYVVMGVLWKIYGKN